MPSPGFEDTSNEDSSTSPVGDELPDDGLADGSHGGIDGGGPVDAGRLQTLQPLTNDLIATVLTARGYTFYHDDDGDLVGKWDDNLIYFFRLGRNRDLLQVRTLADATFSIEDVPRLYAFCNSWNHDRLWPKAFVHVNDDGSVRVCGEVIADLELGVTPHQLDQLINCGISTGCQMSEAVAELRAS